MDENLKKNIIDLLKLQCSYDKRSGELEKVGIDLESFWHLDFQALFIALDLIGAAPGESGVYQPHFYELWKYMVLENEDYERFISVAKASMESEWWDRIGGSLTEINLHEACYE